MLKLQNQFIITFQTKSFGHNQIIIMIIVNKKKPGIYESLQKESMIQNIKSFINIHEHVVCYLHIHKRLTLTFMIRAIILVNITTNQNTSVQIPPCKKRNFIYLNEDNETFLLLHIFLTVIFSDLRTRTVILFRVY